MLSVIEQRAGQWGALAAVATSTADASAPIRPATTSDDQAPRYDATTSTNALYVDAGTMPGDQRSQADSTSYDHPSVSRLLLPAVATAVLFSLLT